MPATIFHIPQKGILQLHKKFADTGGEVYQSIQNFSPLRDIFQRPELVLDIFRCRVNVWK